MSLVGRLDVVHQEAIDVADGHILIEIAGQQVGMPWLGAAVAADVKVPALFRGDQPEILRSGPRRTRARSPIPPPSTCAGRDAAISELDADGKAHRIPHRETAPCACRRTLDRSHRLAVGMAALEAGVDEFFPDFGQRVTAAPSMSIRCPPVIFV